MPETADGRPIPRRSTANTLVLVTLWFVFYASFTLFTPALLDDADSVHAEVAREMLLRHDWVTLYANGIRYLEKAPLLYWSMAVSFKLFGVSTASARIPLALTVLALAFAVEAFARRAFRSTSAGLYAALILLSSFGIFIFTRITIPDAMVCLWLTLAMLCFWLTEADEPIKARVPHSSQSHRDEWEVRSPRLLCYTFATCCALNVLTKGLIGIIFPIAIVAIYLTLTRGLRGAIARTRQLHLLSSLAVFLLIAAPWHILSALANPTQGHPGSLIFSLSPATGAHHWQVPLPTGGNVHGWLWFYFVNEQLLRYLNLRVPHDYDTVPLYLFWGLCLIWLMPWSAFVFKATWYGQAVSSYLWSALRHRGLKRELYRRHLRSALTIPNSSLLLTLWTVVVLLFFVFSTRQEYYVLPGLPALAILIAGWLTKDSRSPWQPVTLEAKRTHRANLRITAVLLALGAIFATASLYFLLHTSTPAPNTDLATLLQQNPGDYAMSMGHFLDLNAQALGLFRLPLTLAALSLLLGPFAAYLLRRKSRTHAATLALAAGAFGFLLAAHLGLRIFAPVLSSQQLAAAIAPQLAPRTGQPPPLIVIHQEYEYGSTLGFYLQRPTYATQNGSLVAINPIHILTDPAYNGVADYGRSSNLWYGSFFPDAPQIFETQQSLAQKWLSSQRIFLWQDLANQPSPLPPMPGPIYVIAKSGGKEMVSNQPNP